MLVESYIDCKFIKERELDFGTFCDRLCNYIEDEKPTKIKIVCATCVEKGVSFSIINRLEVEEVKLERNSEVLIIEFEEFKNAFTINREANVCFDRSRGRLYFKDFGITIFFKN